MQATLTPHETTPQGTDPHDAFEIAPGVVLAGRTEKPSSNLAPQASSPPVSVPLTKPWTPHVAVTSDDAAAMPPADTNFRVTAADHVEVPSANKWASRIFMSLFAVGGAAAAAAWPHYSDAAKQTFANWMPPFALISSPSPETPAAAAPAASPSAEASPQPAAAEQASAAQDTPAAQPTPVAAPAIAAAPATASAAAQPSVPTSQSMARDLATMGQQIEQLKASIEQLKAGQEKMADQMAAQIAQQVARDVRKPKVAKLPDQNARRISALPRAVRKPREEFSTAQTAAILAAQRTAAPLPPPQAAPMPVAPAPYNAQAQVIDRSDGDPVERPPLPVR